MSETPPSGSKRPKNSPFEEAALAREFQPSEIELAKERIAEMRIAEENQVEEASLPADAEITNEQVQAQHAQTEEILHERAEKLRAKQSATEPDVMPGSEEYHISETESKAESESATALETIDIIEAPASNEGKHSEAVPSAPKPKKGKKGESAHAPAVPGGTPKAADKTSDAHGHSGSGGLILFFGWLFQWMGKGIGETFKGGSKGGGGGHAPKAKAAAGGHGGGGGGHH